MQGSNDKLLSELRSIQLKFSKLEKELESRNIAVAELAIQSENVQKTLQLELNKKEDHIRVLNAENTRLLDEISLKSHHFQNSLKEREANIENLSNKISKLEIDYLHVCEQKERADRDLSDLKNSTESCRVTQETEQKSLLELLKKEHDLSMQAIQKKHRKELKYIKDKLTAESTAKIAELSEEVSERERPTMAVSLWFAQCAYKFLKGVTDSFLHLH